MPSIKQIFSPALKRYQLKTLEQKYAKYADHRTIDWNWKSTNFNRIALVNRLVANIPSCKYLEIGCQDNNLFDSVPVINKTGIDPERGGTIRATSDDFFLTNQDMFDVIFLDGLHTYEQVRKDVVNALNCIKTSGYILIHDMLPSDWISQHVPNISQGVWHGDVWKVAFELAKSVDIDFKIVKIDCGVGVIKIHKKDSKLYDLNEYLSDKDFSFFIDHLNELPMTDWSELELWLQS